MKRALIVVLGVLLLDQAIKIWIKLHFCLGESYPVFGSSWFIIHFTENNGMAFGMEFAGRFGKILLSLFRLAAICGISYYVYYLIKKNAHKWLITLISLILAGAIGNLLDSAFYGILFSESTPFEPAVFFSDGGGYAPILYGKVVDMFYFPLFRINFPQWIPFLGGEDFEFFQPVFNIADSAVTVGVFSLLIFQKRLFRKESIETSSLPDSNIKNPGETP